VAIQLGNKAAIIALLNKMADSLAGQAGNNSTPATEMTREELLQLVIQWAKDEIVFKKDLGKALTGAERLMAAIRDYSEPNDRFNALASVYNKIDSFLFNNYGFDFKEKNIDKIMELVKTNGEFAQLLGRIATLYKGILETMELTEKQLVAGSASGKEEYLGYIKAAKPVLAKSIALLNTVISKQAEGQKESVAATEKQATRMEVAEKYLRDHGAFNGRVYGDMMGKAVMALIEALEKQGLNDEEFTIAKARVINLAQRANPARMAASAEEIMRSEGVFETAYGEKIAKAVLATLQVLDDQNHSGASFGAAVRYFQDATWAYTLYAQNTAQAATSKQDEGEKDKVIAATVTLEEANQLIKGKEAGWWKRGELLLITPAKYNTLPDGTVLKSIMDRYVTKGSDNVDMDIRFGLLAFGFEIRQDSSPETGTTVTDLNKATPTPAQDSGLVSEIEARGGQHIDAFAQEMIIKQRASGGIVNGKFNNVKLTATGADAARDIVSQYRTSMAESRKAWEASAEGQAYKAAEAERAAAQAIAQRALQDKFIQYADQPEFKWIREYLQSSPLATDIYGQFGVDAVLELEVTLLGQHHSGASYWAALQLFFDMIKRADPANMVESAEQIMRKEGAYGELYGATLPNAVLELLRVLDNQGHSGASFGLVVSYFDKAVNAYEGSIVAKISSAKINAAELIKEGAYYWDEGKTLLLITPAQLDKLAKGTVLKSINGEYVTVGTDEIDGDTRAGLLAYGFELSQDGESQATQQPVESDTVQDGKGGIDLRAVPIVTQPGMGMGAPAIDMKQLQLLAERSSIKDLDKEWISIQKQMRGKQMPYAKMKEYVAVCAAHKADGKYMKSVAACVGNILKLEEKCALPTSPEMKELLVIIEMSNVS
jgi:hypothetical protein